MGVAPDRIQSILPEVDGRGPGIRHRRAGLGTLGRALPPAALLLPAFDPEKSPRPIAEDAAALAGPGESIGVYRHPTIMAGLAFYSRHHITRLEQGDVEAFLEHGGRIIASRAKHLAELEEMVPFEVHASHRSRGRRYLVLTSAPERSAPSPRSAPGNE
jgi:hypothetical protein